MTIIIPARMGSKGLPFKNRTLFKYTADIIPPGQRPNTWITTDDPEIARMATDYGFGTVIRPPELASDTASVRDTVVHAIETAELYDEFIVMLYLTYPERTWKDVTAAVEFFLPYYQRGQADSLLCKKELKSHPYLCLREHGAGGAFGRQLVSHDLYRRQDYPKCFEISHFISIFDTNGVYKLNNNLYGESTVFYEIRDVVDVDTDLELNKFNGE